MQQHLVGVCVRACASHAGLEVFDAVQLPSTTATTGVVQGRMHQSRRRTRPPGRRPSLPSLVGGEVTASETASTPTPVPPRLNNVPR